MARLLWQGNLLTGKLLQAVERTRRGLRTASQKRMQKTFRRHVQPAPVVRLSQNQPHGKRDSNQSPGVSTRLAQGGAPLASGGLGRASDPPGTRSLATVGCDPNEAALHRFCRLLKNLRVGEPEIGLTRGIRAGYAPSTRKTFCAERQIR